MRASRYLVMAAALALCAQHAAIPQAAPAQHSAIVRRPALRSLAMVTPASGWALEASTVLRTTTGGTLWVDVTPQPEVVISQDSRAFARDARTEWVTAIHDGGATWSSTTPLPYKPTTGSPSWDFADQNHGWVAIGATLHATVDGGRHWSPHVVSLGIQSVAQLNFVNANDGWALGTRVGACLKGSGPLAGRPLLRTVDGGRTWTRLSSYATYPPDGNAHTEAAG